MILKVLFFICVALGGVLYTFFISWTNHFIAQTIKTCQQQLILGMVSESHRQSHPEGPNAVTTTKKSSLFTGDVSNSSKLDMTYHFVQPSLYIISAYYEDRITHTNTKEGMEGIVKVLGTGTMDYFNGSATCSFTSTDLMNATMTVNGHFEKIGTGSIKFFQPIWVICPITIMKKVPFLVSISIKNSTKKRKTPKVPLHYLSKRKGTKFKVAACVQPIFNYENPLDLIEWIEFHRILGIEHFSIYDMSAGPLTRKVLKTYEGIVDTVKYKLPLNETMFYNNNQMAALQHCLYKYRFLKLATWVSQVDLDEFILPGKNSIDNFTNYYEFLQDKSTNKKNETGTIAAIQFNTKFAFRHFNYTEYNTYFMETTDMDQDLRGKYRALGVHLKLVTERCRLSSSNFRYRTKYFMKPEAVTVAGIHYPGSFIPGNKTLLLLEDDMHFVHFRECTENYVKGFCMSDCSTCENFTTTCKSEDIAMDSFGRELIKRVKERIDLLNFDIFNTTSIYKYHPTPSTTVSPLTESTSSTTTSKRTTSKMTTKKLTTKKLTTTTRKKTSTTTKPKT